MADETGSPMPNDTCSFALGDEPLARWMKHQSITMQRQTISQLSEPLGDRVGVWLREQLATRGQSFKQWQQGRMNRDQSFSR